MSDKQIGFLVYVVLACVFGRGLRWLVLTLLGPSQPEQTGNGVGQRLLTDTRRTTE